MKSLIFVVIQAIVWLSSHAVFSVEPLPIGSRRELFVDDYLIDRMTGVSLKAHRPEPREAVFTCDEPPKIIPFGLIT